MKKILNKIMLPIVSDKRCFQKQMLVLMLGITLISGLLMGCNNAKGTNSEQNKVNEESASTTNQVEKEDVLFWIRGSESDPICQAIQADIDKYNNLEDGLGIVKIEYVPITDFATKFNTAFAGGTAPDMVDTGVDQISIRAHMKHYLPLDDYLAEWEYTDQIMESYMNAGKMLDDGKTYGLAYAPTPCVFVWRKDYFEEVGLDPEIPPKDWEEMLEYAKKLVVKEGDSIKRGGFSLEPNDIRLFTLMARQAGCELYDPTTNMPLINDNAAVKTLQYFVDIQPYSILYNPAPGANTLRSFLTSESAMAYITTEELASMIKNDPSLEDKIGVASYIPAVDGVDSTWCGYRLFAINADSKVKEAAWDAIKFLMTEESNRNRLENANVPPAYTSMQEEYIKINEKVNAPAVESINVGEPFPKTDWMSTYSEAVKNAQQEVLYGGKAAEQALDDAVNLIITDANLN